MNTGNKFFMVWVTDLQRSCPAYSVVLWTCRCSRISLHLDFAKRHLPFLGAHTILWMYSAWARHFELPWRKAVILISQLMKSITRRKKTSQYPNWNNRFSLQKHYSKVFNMLSFRSVIIDETSKEQLYETGALTQEYKPAVYFIISLF